MNFLSIGDLAQSFRLRNHQARMQDTLQRLTTEVSTGLKADPAAAVSGDFATLSSIDRDLARIGAFATTGSEAATLADTVQSALGAVQDHVGTAMSGLVGAALTLTAPELDTIALDARERLGGVVAALNARTADRYALSGVATSTAPLPDASVLLAAAGAAIAGQTTPAGIAAALQAWFDAPAGSGGFADQIYGGASRPLAPLALGEGVEGRLEITALDPALRDTLRGFTLAALVDAGALAGDRAGRSTLLRNAGETLAGADSGLTVLRSGLGTLQERIDTAATRNASEKHRLQIARNDIMAVDSYETASALEAVRSQTEMLYTITGRLADLRLADYLR